MKLFLGVLLTLVSLTFGPSCLAQYRPWNYNTGPRVAIPQSGEPGYEATSPYYVTTDNAVIEGKNFGTVIVNADNVTFRDCYFRGGGFYNVLNNGAGVKLEYCEFVNTKEGAGEAIRGSNVTVRHSHFHDQFGDAIKPWNNVVIEYNFFEKLGRWDTTGPDPEVHADGVQIMENRTNVVVRYNNFNMPAGLMDGDIRYENSQCILVHPTASNLTIVGNWINGGGYSVNINPGATNVVVKGNRFTFGYNFGPGLDDGPADHVVTCNVWHDAGTYNGVSYLAGDLMPGQDSGGDCDAPILQDLKFLPEWRPDIEVPDITWPEEFGEAEVTFWKDDKISAASVTIDDNQGQNHNTWRNFSAQHGFKFTWFVITSFVGSGPSVWGTWDQFNTLYSEGHDIQSHTAYTGTSGNLIPDYEDAITDIEANVPGEKVEVLAYTNGTGDFDLAMEYYLAARGTSGHPNYADNIRYDATNSMGLFSFGTGPWNSLPDTHNYNPGNVANYRAWASYHYHSISPTDVLANVTAGLQYLKNNEDEIWVGLWADVAKYGQQRETAKLVSRSVQETRIEFDLYDWMDDERFDYPLTVKVRLTPEWTAINATQDGSPIAYSIVEHAGQNYALVQAVPDRGRVALVRESEARRPLPQRQGSAQRVFIGF